MQIEILKTKDCIDNIVEIHLQTFKGFFLTFLGKGFLKQLYKGFLNHPDSNIIVAKNNGSVVGFLAFSYDLSGFYNYLIKTALIPFAWYSFLAFCRSPKVLLKLVKALLKPKESKRDENYIEVSSIGVSPDCLSMGIGSQMLGFLKDLTTDSEYDYIKLETDADDNIAANRFYQKNGFLCTGSFVADGGRKMNEYRFNIKRAETINI